MLINDNSYKLFIQIMLFKVLHRTLQKSLESICDGVLCKKSQAAT